MSAKPLDLGAYLKEKGSPLADHVSALHRVANRHRVDPRFIVAIAGAESSFGKISKGNNAWGIGPHRRYPTWEDGLEAAASLLRKYYIGEGRKSVALIGAKWAPVGAGNDPRNLNSNWVRNVKSIYASLGGNPDDVTLGWRKGAAPQVVQKLPSQQPGYVKPPPPASLLGSSEEVALQNLGRIARGESPTRTLKDLTSAVMQERQAEAAARTTVRETEPQPVATATVEDKVPEPEPTLGRGKPDPSWGGSFSVAKTFADVGFRNGLKAISEKRDRQNTKTGGVSDHWVGKKNAYAYDLSDGDQPTPAMDATAVEIASLLGYKYDGKGALVLTKNVNGYRVQVLYRTEVGGNHYNHIHVGVEKL